MSQQVGKFQLLREIATGGMAEIHIAKQTLAEGVEKLVVVKRLRSDVRKNKEYVHMFLNEARIAARLIHPNVVQMYDLGYIDGDYYITMEYIHGENLRTIANTSKKVHQSMSVPESVYVVSQTCRGLQYAHTKTDVAGRPLNVVHCDISPQNIVVSFAGEVKILDFGVAMATSQFNEPSKVVVKGKLAYMSPEQCQGQALDLRSDIFSVGIVLWELVTRRRLYKYPTMGEIVHHICEEDVPSVRTYNPTVLPYLDTIIRKCLGKNPDERYQSAEELVETLDEFVTREGLSAGGNDLMNLMRRIFPGKLEKIQKIEKAQESGALESVLFHDLEIVTEQEPSLSGEDSSSSSVLSFQTPSPPSAAVVAPIATPVPAQPPPARSQVPAATRRRVHPALIVAAAAAVAGSLLALFLSKREPVRTTATEDAGPPPPAAQGIVRVASQPPQALVSIDGVERCLTPCIVQKVGIGQEHTLSVSKKGFLAWTTRFNLEKEFDVGTFDVSLQPVPARRKTPPPPPEPGEADPTQATHETKPPPEGGPDAGVQPEVPLPPEDIWEQ